MARFTLLTIDPDDSLSIASALTQLQQIVTDQLDLGHPGFPGHKLQQTVVTALAGAGDNTSLANTLHNGETGNFNHAWVEVEFSGTNTAVAFKHNLNLDVPDANLPNVRWLFTNFQHNGAGPVTGTAALALSFDTGDTVTADSIELRLYAAATRTVDGSNKVKVTTLMVPAIQ
jgi:hypothetical protein